MSVSARQGLATPRRADADDDRSSLAIGGLAVGGAAGVLGGIGLKVAGHGRLGFGAAAVGAALIGASLLTAKLGKAANDLPVPGDEGESGGNVSWYPGSMELLRDDRDRTNPAPGDYTPSSGSRDAREGVVQIVHDGGTGSGWVVEPRTIVTNYHVAQGHRELTIVDHAGEEHDGVVRKLDRQHDLAIVDVASLGDAALPMDDVVELRELAETTGYPDGEFRNDEAEAIARIDVDDDGRRRSALLLQGSSAEGVSGGAIINGSGEVIGTAFAVGEYPDGDIGVVLAIPNEQVREFLDAPMPAAPERAR